MDIRETVGGFKPHLIGGVIGAIAVTVLGFSMDWVVSTGNMEQQVREARVNLLAQVCEVNAEAHWVDSGNELAALEGWDNEDRKNLASQFTPDIEGISAISEDVTDECDDALRPA